MKLLHVTLFDAWNFVDQYKGARQRRDLIPYLFNIFIEEFLQYTTQETLHAPITGTVTVPALLFAVRFDCQ